MLQQSLTQSAEQTAEPKVQSLKYDVISKTEPISLDQQKNTLKLEEKQSNSNYNDYVAIATENENDNDNDFKYEETLNQITNPEPEPHSNVHQSLPQHQPQKKVVFSTDNISTGNKDIEELTTPKESFCSL